jgi:hypothetical protein
LENPEQVLIVVILDSEILYNKRRRNKLKDKVNDIVKNIKEDRKLGRRQYRNEANSKDYEDQKVDARQSDSPLDIKIIQREERKKFPFLKSPDSVVYNHPLLRDESKLHNRIKYLKKQANFINYLFESHTDLETMKELLYFPIPVSTGKFQLSIKRYNSGFTKFYPKYVLYITMRKNEGNRSGNSSLEHNDTDNSEYKNKDSMVVKEIM